jgi:hypothetical protein
LPDWYKIKIASQFSQNIIALNQKNYPKSVWRRIVSYLPLAAGLPPLLINRRGLLTASVHMALPACRQHYPNNNNAQSNKNKYPKSMWSVSGRKPVPHRLKGGGTAASRFRLLQGNKIANVHVCNFISSGGFHAAPPPNRIYSQCLQFCRLTSCCKIIRL